MQLGALPPYTQTDGLTCNLARDFNGAGDEYAAAQAQCDADVNCGGIYDFACDDSGFTLCDVGYTEQSVDSGCMYRKPEGGQFALDSSEHQHVTSGGLQIGENCGSQTINGITATHSATIEGVVTLLAVRDLAALTFSGESSTFFGLSAQADNGLSSSVDITTTSSWMKLTSDADASDDGSSDIALTGARSLVSATAMDLDSASGDITADDSLVLEANTGIHVHNSITISGSEHEVKIQSDKDSISEHGMLTLADGTTLSSTDSLVWITAYDVNLEVRLSSLPPLLPILMCVQL